MILQKFRRVAAPIALALALTGSLYAAPKEKAFASPEEAVKAVSRAMQNKDSKALVDIFGPDFQQLESKDPAERKAVQQKLATLFKEGWSLTTTQDQHRVIRLGHEGWSFPVPLVKTGSAWAFNTELGKEEIANRRVGRNELIAIQTCQLIADAEEAFKKGPGDGDYTAKLVSTSGAKDGLYYPSAGDGLSPLETYYGPTAAFTQTRVKGSPWFGYYYSLTPKDSKDGYVMVAWPAAYDDTGVMSFWTDESGTVYQKDLGSKGGTELRTMNTAQTPSDWDLVDLSI